MGASKEGTGTGSKKEGTGRAGIGSKMYGKGREPEVKRTGSGKSRRPLSLIIYRSEQAEISLSEFIILSQGRSSEILVYSTFNDKAAEKRYKNESFFYTPEKVSLLFIELIEV